MCNVNCLQEKRLSGLIDRTVDQRDGVFSSIIRATVEVLEEFLPEV